MEAFVTGNPGIALYTTVAAAAFLFWKTVKNSDVEEGVVYGVLLAGGAVGLVVKSVSATKHNAAPAEEGTVLILVSVIVASLVVSTFVPDFSK